MSTQSESASSVYQRIIGGWNAHDADEFAAPFADDGEMIGFDGSQISGRSNIADELKRIFNDHDTAPYFVKVKEVKALTPDVTLLRAIAGMVPPGQSEINPDVNAHHTVVLRRSGEHWEAVLLQNTPAQFHGRPELVQAMTKELRELL